MWRPPIGAGARSCRGFVGGGFNGVVVRCSDVVGPGVVAVCCPAAGPPPAPEPPVVPEPAPVPEPLPVCCGGTVGEVVLWGVVVLLVGCVCVCGWLVLVGVLPPPEPPLAGC